MHLFGQCAEMDEIRQIATAARGIPIIEDACQAIGAEYRGQRAGSLGTLGAFSFYPTKNLGGFGDGGMITTNDDELAAKLRVLAITVSSRGIIIISSASTAGSMRCRRQC